MLIIISSILSIVIAFIIYKLTINIFKSRNISITLSLKGVIVNNFMLYKYSNYNEKEVIYYILIIPIILLGIHLIILFFRQ
jgi:hypothetical protein